jgi:hypothetical protein
VGGQLEFTTFVERRLHLIEIFVSRGFDTEVIAEAVVPLAAGTKRRPV